jgi:hypothetical protein
MKPADRICGFVCCGLQSKFSGVRDRRDDHRGGHGGPHDPSDLRASATRCCSGRSVDDSNKLLRTADDPNARGPRRNGLRPSSSSHRPRHILRRALEDEFRTAGAVAHSRYKFQPVQMQGVLVLLL